MIRATKSWVLTKLALRANVQVGRRFHVGPGSVLWAPRMLVVGNDVYVGKNVTIEVDGSIGDGTLIANNVGVVGRLDHKFSQEGEVVSRSAWVGDFPDELSRPVTIGADVWIGFGSTVLSGITIGDSVVVGAGSLVTRDIPPNSIAVGSPARVVGPRFDAARISAHWGELRRQGYRLSGEASSEL